MINARPSSKLFRRSHTCAMVAATVMVTLFFGLPALPAAAQEPSRAPAPAAAAPKRPSTAAVGKAPTLPAHASVKKPLSPSTALHLTMVLSPRDPRGLAALAREVSTPGSPEYRHYLAPGRFARTYGPTAATVTAVRTELTRLGLHPGPTSGNGLAIPISTTAGRAGAAFDVALVNVGLPNGRTAYANTDAPRITAALAPAVAGILGLDSLSAAAPQLVIPPAPAHPVTKPTPTRRATPKVGVAGEGAPTPPQPCAAATAGASAYGAYTADQLAQAYDFGGLYGQGTMGAGVTVALVELAGYNPSDIAAYQACYGTSAQVVNVNVDGGNPAAGGIDEVEVELDIEDVIGLAPQAVVEPYIAEDTYPELYDVYNKIVSDDNAKVVSTSWAQCEALLPSGFAAEENTLFEQAAVQGQSIFAAAGDDGSTGCVGSRDFAVLDPASNPLVTGVGGTTLEAASAPPTEVTWNNGLNSGGGGISANWQMAAGQQGPGVDNPYSTGTVCGAPLGALCREVPDVSASADQYHGYTIYYTGTGLATTGWQAVGGTSAASPLWVAFAALADQNCVCALGDLNPPLYDVAARDSGAFNDITVGNDDLGRINGGAYPATPGYDQATGLGTPVGSTLAIQLATVADDEGEPPLLTADSPPATGGSGVAFGYTFAALGKPAPTFAMAGGTLPPGLTLDATTGLLAGTPTTTGVYNFTVAATNSAGPPASSPSLTITIVGFVAPAFTSPSTATFPAGQQGDFTVTATGTPTPAIREIGPMPEGISLVDNGDGTATLRGTSTWGTSVAFSMTASNGATVSQDFTLIISSPPLLTADAPTAGLLGLPYGYLFTSSGSPPPTFSVASGSLPPGLQLEADGGLWGTPTADGQYSFSVVANNGVGPPMTTATLSVAVATPVPGTFFSVAGTGISHASGIAGDGGPAELALMGGPYAMAVDSAGNLYVADVLDNRVRKITPAGIVTDFAGSPTGVAGNSGDGGPATAALLDSPMGVAVDGAGNVYIADTLNHRIRKVNPDGVITAFAGNPNGWYGNGGDGGQAGAAELGAPMGLAFDAAGDLFVADFANNRVREIDTAGIVSDLAGSPNGIAGNTGDGGPATGALLDTPRDVVVDAAGDVIVSDSGNNRVRKVSPSGVITNFAGSPAGSDGDTGDGGPATAAEFWNPIGLAYDAVGDLYVVDAANNRVRMINPAGTISDFAGSATGAVGFDDATSGDGGPATSAEIQDPGGVAVAGNGDVYIADTTNNRVDGVFEPPPSPQFTSAVSASFTVGVPSTLSVTVVDDPGVTVTEAGALPTGVTFNAATNTMAGSPAQATSGTYPITFTATGTNGTVTQSFTLTVDQAQFTYPTNGQSGVDTAEPFTWSTIPQAQGYLVAVGSRLYAADLAVSGVLPASTTSWPMPSATPGRTIYATLFTEVSGTWTSYQAISFIAGAGQASFVYPVTGQSGVDPTRPLSWATVAGAQGYDLVVGTTPSNANVANSGVLAAAVSSFQPPTLPAGKVLYATLFTEVAGGWSRYQSISFTTGAAQAVFTHPVNAQVGLGPALTFTWTTLYAAQAYLLTVGTAPFGTNVLNSGLLAPGTAGLAVSLPAGKAMYATLYTESGGKWVYQSIVFATGR